MKKITLWLLCSLAWNCRVHSVNSEPLPSLDSSSSTSLDFSSEVTEATDESASTRKYLKERSKTIGSHVKQWNDEHLGFLHAGTLEVPRDPAADLEAIGTSVESLSMEPAVLTEVVSSVELKLKRPTDGRIANPPRLCKIIRRTFRDALSKCENFSQFLGILFFKLVNSYRLVRLKH